MGGVLQDDTNWTDPAPASHFPFIPDSQPRQLQDVGAYRPQQEKREWAVGETHRAVRDREGECERRILREGWQRRWEACSPVHYRREAPKRSLTDSSYRELEAWAARYSHSLPRRRRIEAELRGASQPQGLLESNRVLERDSRSGTEPRVAALHQTGLSANIRELEQWGKGSRQQTMSHYPSQPLVSDTTYMSDTKEKNTGYQRRMFSPPPGYIAPPPYDSPHNSSPVMHHCDRYSTGWEQEANRQIYRSQPTSRKQNVVGLQGERRGEEKFTKEVWKQRICSDTGEHKQQIQATDHLLTSSLTHPQSTEMQPDCLSSSVQPPTEQKVQRTNIKEENSSNVIEGRKFSFNKKRGGQTIFCLVSRMGGTTGLSSSPNEPLKPSPSPLITPSPQTSGPDLGQVSRGLGDCGDINLVHKFADEVDFNVRPLQVESFAPAQPSYPKMGRNIKAKPRETQNWMESKQASAHREELLDVIQRRVKQREDQSNKTEGDVAFTEKSNINNTNPGVQSLPTASVKYPLWREPHFKSRVKSSSPCCLKTEREEGESGQGLSNREGGPEVGGHPFDIEVRRLEIKKGTESEDSCGLVVIDTTCVIVRVELIPPPKKDHVHYQSSSPHSEHNPPDEDSIPPTESIESDDQRMQDITPEESKDTSTQVNPLPKDEMPVTESKESDQDKVHSVSNAEVTETEALLQAEEVSQISSTSLPSPPNSERETLEERAERILGIPLLDDLIQHQTHDAISSVDLCAQDQNEEGETSQLTNNEINDVIQHQTQDAIYYLASCIQDQNEEGETSRLSSNEISDVDGSLSELVMEQPVSQQPLKLGTAEDAACGAESDVNPDQLPKEDNEDLTDLCERTLNISKENAIDYHPETEVKQPLELGKSEDAACVAESDVTQDQLPKDYNEDLADLLEQASTMSEQNAIDCQPQTELKQPLELERSEDAACVAESDVIQDQLPMEDNEDLPDLCEQTSNIPEQKAIDCQPETEVKQPLKLHKEDDDTCATKSDVTQDQLSNEDREDLADLSEQMSHVSKENAIDCQLEIEVQSLQEITNDSLFEYCSQQEQSQEAKDQACDSDIFPQLPSQSLNSHINQSHLFPHPPSNFLDGQKSRSAFDFMPPLSQLTSLSHVPELNPDLPRLSSSANSALNPEALESGTSETSPHLESQTPPPSSSPPHDPSTRLQCLDISDENIPPDFSPSVEHREEPQYPKSLWDAVNRIRKHTAPDSENEEEEVGELWDRESAGEDFVSLDVVVDLNTADPVFRCSEGLQAATAFPVEASSKTKERESLDEPEQLEVPKGETVEDVVIWEIEQDKCHEEQRGHLDDDALSCSSTNSHGSDDTVIVGAEGEVEEKISDSETEEMEIHHEGEIKTDDCKPCVAEEEELTCDDKITNNTVVEEEGEDARNDKMRDLN